MRRDLKTMKHEFSAGDDSFLLKLRTQLEWDRAAFSTLVEAMKECCEDLEGARVVDRWMAEGFWYLSWFVKQWSSHPDFPRVELPDYYARAHQRLEDLAYWFFMGESPYEDGCGFDPL